MSWESGAAFVPTALFPPFLATTLPDLAASLPLQIQSWWPYSGRRGTLPECPTPRASPRDYGYPKLGDLIGDQDYVEVKEVSVESGASQLHVRIPRSRRGR